MNLAECTTNICNCIPIFIFCIRCEPHVFEYIFFLYCNPCLITMFFNFWYYHVFFNYGIVIHVGWSCFSMYCNWYEIKFVCFVYILIMFNKNHILNGNLYKFICENIEKKFTFNHLVIFYCYKYIAHGFRLCFKLFTFDAACLPSYFQSY